MMEKSEITKGVEADDDGARSPPDEVFVHGGAKVFAETKIGVGKLRMRKK